MEFSEVSCPVCEKNNYKVVYQDTLGRRAPVFGYKWTPEIRKMYRLVRCRECDHAYASPRLVDMYKYYEDVKDDEYLKNVSLRKKTAEKVLSTIKTFVKKGRLLDVGCATGDFLEVARNIYNVEGLELSDWAIKLASEKGLKIYKEELQYRAKTCNDHYDVITMWGVIEHLEFPKREIATVNRLLKIDGIVCFWTGDFNSIYSKILGKRWLYLLGQHVQFFSWKSLDRLMKDSGFERVHKGIYPYVISFEYLGISLSRYSVLGGLARSAFKYLGLNKREFTITKSDEMFAIYRKVMDA